MNITDKYLIEEGYVKTASRITPEFRKYIETIYHEHISCVITPLHNQDEEWEIAVQDSTFRSIFYAVIKTVEDLEDCYGFLKIRKNII